MDLRAAEFESVLALHLNEGNLPGWAGWGGYLDNEANKTGRENEEVIGILFCRLDLTIVAIVKEEVKGRWI